MIGRFLMSFILFLGFSSNVISETTKKDEFLAKISSSIRKVKIDEPIQVELEMQFPSTYHPDLEVLRKHLLWNGNLMGYSFNLVSMKIEPPKQISEEKKSQKIAAVVEFKIPGQQSVTFLNIPFQPNEEGPEKEVNIISDIINFEVRHPESTPSFQGRIAPLLTFSSMLPIEISQTNRQNNIESPILNDSLARHHQQIINSRTVPWLEIFLIFSAITVFFSARKFLFSLSVFEKPSKSEFVDIQQETVNHLKKLELQDLPAKQQYDQFYVKLTNLIRDYIVRCYQLDAPHLTTEEFLIKVKSNISIPDKTRQALSEFLTAADRVKFAKYQPSQEDCDNAFKAAEELIKDV